MSDKTDKHHDEVVGRLDAIIKILLETGGKDASPVPIVTRIKWLHESGMRPVEISRVLGKTLSYVTKELSRIKKER